MDYLVRTDETKNKIRRLIKRFNTVNGTRFRTSNDENITEVLSTLNLTVNHLITNGMAHCVKDEDELINDFLTIIGRKVGEYNLSSLSLAFIDIKQLLIKEYTMKYKSVEDEKCEEVESHNNENNTPISQMDITSLVSGITSTVISALGGIDKTSVVNDVVNEAKQLIEKEYGHIEKKITLNYDNGTKKEINGVLHSKFDEVLAYVNNDIPVYLAGPAGSGKNVLCQQIAEALGLDFYFSNAVTQEYKITGFTDANGTYHESQFYKAFKNGGVFMLDEMDASIPEVLIILNSALANRYFDFPAPIGKVIAHKDFRVVSAGNTYGAGADFEYVGRNQLDGASLDRFAMVRVDYDSRIEENCANGNTELLNFCRKFRKAVEKVGIKTIVSYRSISRMAKLDNILPTEDLLESCLIKSLGRDDINLILPEVSGCGKYTDAMRTILTNRA